MQKIFMYYLCGVMAIAMVAIALLNFVLQSKNMENKMVDNSLVKIEQITHTIDANKKELNNLIDGLNEDYLTRARAFSYIIAQNPKVLESQIELNKIKVLLNVDELHFIDERGILIQGTIPQYFGMDFRSTKQTAEFLQILKMPSSALVQSAQPNGAEKKIFQYTAVAREDRAGIVQIGLEPRRQIEAKARNELPYIFSHMLLDADNDIFAVDLKTNQVLAHSNEENIGKNITELGFSDGYLEQFKEGDFLRTSDVQEHRFYLVRQYNEIALGIGQSSSSLYEGRQQQMLLVLLYLFFTFFIVILVIHYLLKRQIVSGVHQIMSDLGEITTGNLDRVVRVDNNPEFFQLSAKINQMVENLLNTTVKISHIIDLVEAPIGAYECKKDMERVLATDRLRHVLSLSKAEAAELYKDKHKFIEKLHTYMQLYPPMEEDDVYQISNEPGKWIRVRTVSDDTGTFGMVLDVTKEILEKKSIQKERDYDALTNLYSRRSFTRNVTAVLENGNVDVAALIMLDLDAFKQINDIYGHSVGDAYLQSTANFLAEICHTEKNCIAGRRSGDEFYLFLYRFKTKEEVRKILYDFYEKLNDMPFIFSATDQKTIRISAGIAWHNETLSEFDELLCAADKAMYRVKRNKDAQFGEYDET